MNPWLRLALFFGILVVSVLLLKLVPAPIVLVLFVGGVAGVNHVLRSRQRADPEHVTAGGLGLERIETDRSGVLALPFVLLGRTSATAVRDVVRGRRSVTDVTVFDLVMTASGSGGAVERTSTCAVAPADFEGPHLVVEPRAFLLPAPGLPEVLVGPDPFHRAFDVRCRDETFARSLLDEGWTAWLLQQGERWGFELDPGRALLYGDRVPSERRVEILDALAALLERLAADAVERPSAPTPPRPDEPAS